MNRQVWHPDQFHGTGPFDIKTGRQLSVKKGPTYTDVFSQAMVKLGKENPKLVGITAAMKEGTGLKAFEKVFSDRLFDVGIAEEHAVSFAAGLALGGVIPVVAIYSSFLQRAVDQMLHDVCMQKLHVIFAIDRAGLVGADGETHQGNFDLSYLTMMPNMTVMAPKMEENLKKCWNLQFMRQDHVQSVIPKALHIRDWRNLTARYVLEKVKFFTVERKQHFCLLEA